MKEMEVELQRKEGKMGGDGGNEGTRERESD